MRRDDDDASCYFKKAAVVGKTASFFCPSSSKLPLLVSERQSIKALMLYLNSKLTKVIKTFKTGLGYFLVVVFCPVELGSLEQEHNQTVLGFLD